MDSSTTSFLAPDEPRPFTVTNEDGRSPLLIICDHAGKYFPRGLKMLGLNEVDRERHIAWDIGAGAVACALGDALDAVVIRQNYSRLVIDCNRQPGSETSIAEVSEYTTVPGNKGLGKAERKISRSRNLRALSPSHSCRTGSAATGRTANSAHRDA